MKKQNISPLNNLIDLVLGVAILIMIASVFYKCSDKKKRTHEAGILEMSEYHAPKGLVTEHNDLLTIKVN